jgi:putative FmdB family regulatory protein
MPTYSYQCRACEHAFDIQQAFTDDSLTTCPECTGELRKVFSAIGVTFQGSGFYRTDSRAEAKASSSPKKSSDTKSSDSTSSGGSDKKSTPKKSESSSSSSSSGSKASTPAASKTSS